MSIIPRVFIFQVVVYKKNNRDILYAWPVFVTGVNRQKAVSRVKRMAAVYKRSYVLNVYEDGFLRFVIGAFTPLHIMGHGTWERIK